MSLCLYPAGCGIEQRTATPEQPPQLVTPEEPPQLGPPATNPLQPLPEKQAPPPPSSPPPASRVPEKPPLDARGKAALAISRQAEDHLAKHQPEPAIQLLERAINLDPHNGRTYFHMARAWMMKGNQDQALEFNRLAEIHLGSDPAWQDRIAGQRNIIERMKP